MKDNNDNELRKFAHVSLVASIVVFSTSLFVLNIIAGWENWVLFLLIAAPVICCVLHIKQYPGAQTRLHIYVIILLVETFYYCVNIYMIYDAAPIVVMVMILFAMSQEYLFVWLALIAGYAGMILHIFENQARGILKTDSISIIRLVLHFIIILIAGILVLSIEKAVRMTRMNFEEKIRVLREQNNSASDFLANVSHEIRTPINAVVGLTGVCMDKETDEDIKEDMASVVEAGRRISDQISDILDYSEIDIENLAVNEEDYMMSSVLQDIVNKVKPYKNDNIELIIDVNPALPSILHSDSGKIKKILLHLIVNGLKYTNEGGVYVHISYKEEEYGINLNIEVRDTGIGMDDEELARIFERFYQANSSISRRAGGLGLGMPITAGFVKALGGFITVDSQQGKGTSVHISLPQRVIDKRVCMSVVSRDDIVIGSFLHFDKYEHSQVREYYVEMIKNMVKGLNVKIHRFDNVDEIMKFSNRIPLTHLFLGEEQYEMSVPYFEELASKTLVTLVTNGDYQLPKGSNIKIMKKPFYGFPVVNTLNSRVADKTPVYESIMCPDVRALVVDDEPLNLTVARGILHKYGMLVITAESGAEAVETCRNERFDIIFMDHMMPGMDGIEAMKGIRSISYYRNNEIPIVALTANATSSARETFMAEGFNGFVSKPIEISELERVIKSVLPAALLKKENTEKGTDNFAAIKMPVDEEGSSEFVKILEEVKIDVAAGRKYAQNDDDFYRELLEQFYDEADGKKNKLEDFYKKSDYKNYEIMVHAVKSTAKMIGADKLSKQALELENAAKEEDIELILKKHRSMMNCFTDTAEAVGKAIGKQNGNHNVINNNIEDEDMFFFEPLGGDEA